MLCTAHKIWSFPCGVSEELLARHCTAQFEPKRERERERETGHASATHQVWSFEDFSKELDQSKSPRV